MTLRERFEKTSCFKSIKNKKPSLYFRSGFYWCDDDRDIDQQLLGMWVMFQGLNK